MTIHELRSYYYEDLSVGMKESIMKTVMDSDIVGFAEISGDANPIHLCDVYASKTRFGQRIAHGLYTASLISAVLGTRLPGPGAVYRSQTLAFHAPVRIGDVFVRRVHVSFAWLPPLAGRVLDRLLRREPRVAPAPTIERLRSRKAEVSDQLDQLRASTRFEAPPEIVIDPQAIEQPTAAPSESKAPAPSLSSDQPAEDSYTARLLKAKKKVWEQQKRDER